MFGSSSSPDTRIDWCGAEIHPGRLAYGQSSTEVDFVIPDESDHVALLVPEDLLRHYLGEESVEAAALRDLHHLGCHSRLSDELVRMMHRLIDDFLAQPELLTDERVCNAIEWQLLGTLVQAFHDSNRSARRISPLMRRLAFLRAIEHGEQLSHPISVPELAVAAGVSPRVLELAFRETLNTTPLRYLRWNRMNRAKRDLLAAEAGAILVKDIAAHWGFVDFGRFAVGYKHLFGESPSETLKRSMPPLPKRLEDALRA